MSYNDTINYLYGLQKHGIKLGLDNITEMLSLFNNPQSHFKSIHIAGTNGKGSTSAMVASILAAAGYKVGLFTSPHLVSFTERIRVSNEEITEHEVVELTEEIRDRIHPPVPSLAKEGEGRVNPTFFEFVTAMGFLYFKRKDVEWAVVETGMGGRLDATNVLIPEVSVITGVSYDHEEFLGDTITEIAVEKAGIIKNGVPVVISAQELPVLNVIGGKAVEKSSPLFIYGKDFNGVLKSSDINGITFDYDGDDYTIKDVFMPLVGEHQLFNACLAVKAAIIALSKVSGKQYAVYNKGKIGNKKSAYCLLPTAYCQIKEGLAATKWPGRLELISDNPPILIDGAHNPSASAVLADSLKKNFLKVYKRIILIMGIMADKDLNGILAPLLPLASEIIFTAPAYERAASPQLLAECASAMGFTNIHISPTVKEAIEMATKCCESGNRRIGESEKKNNHFTHSPIRPFTYSLILITGSFYTIGEAKEILEGKGILSRLRETV